MRFQVSEELRQPIGSRARYRLTEGTVPLGDESVLTDLVGEVELLRTDEGLLLSLDATCSVRQACSRCLEDVDCPLALKFQEEYLPTVDVVTSSPLRLPEDADNFLIDADFVLDLREAIRQYSLLGEPAKPLCRPDCRGLCPRCGRNLNAGPCGCPVEAGPAWEALAGLASDLASEERS